MADPRYPVVMIGGVPVVDAPQEIHAANAESFRKVLVHTADRGHPALVVNMSGTRLCDPPGVAVLAWAHGYAVAKGGDLLLVVPPGAAVLGVFAVAGIDRLIPGFAALNEALKHAHAVVPRPLHRRATPSAEPGSPDA
jgi:anti-anti-sigma factor